MDAKVRRTKMELKLLGTGVMAFGAWTFFKYALSNIIYQDGADEILNDQQLNILQIIIWLMVGMDFLMRLYIGLSARGESSGKRKTCLYLIASVILFIFCIFGIMVEFYMLFTFSEPPGYMIITMIIDITATIILGELIIDAVGVRRNRKASEAPHES